MILQVKTEKELIASLELISGLVITLQHSNKELNKKIDAMQIQLNKKPNKVVTKTVTREIEKPTITKVQTVKLDASVIPAIKKLTNRVSKCEKISPVINNPVTIETDKSLLPELKKLSARVSKCEKLSARIDNLEKIKPVINEITNIECNKAIDPRFKKLSDRLVEVEKVKPAIKQITHSLSDSDVSEIINKHVTIGYVNKLYKKGK